MEIDGTVERQAVVGYITQIDVADRAMAADRSAVHVESLVAVGTCVQSSLGTKAVGAQVYIVVFNLKAWSIDVAWLLAVVAKGDRVRDHCDRSDRISYHCRIRGFGDCGSDRHRDHCG